MSRIKILVEGPALTRSGYGEHARLVLRSLREREDLFDICLNPLNWGATGWISPTDEETVWMNRLVEKYQNNTEDLVYDIQIHVGIPSEFTKKAQHSVCVTAGIESTKISPLWIEKSYEIDKIIVPSEFSKWVFENTFYDAQKETGEKFRVGCGAPVEVVSYPVKTFKNTPDLGLDFKNDFNFLTVAQWGIRKNLENCIYWFLEEFGKEDVGLVVKTNIVRNSIPDREFCKERFDLLLKDLENREDIKASIYLLHGDMSDEEMNSLYRHPKIKAFVTSTHGEGFGLPIFEAVYNELPVVAPGWSGHMDFLYAPVKDKRTNKLKNKPLFAKVDYTLKHVQDEAVWKDILVKESMWCYPVDRDFKSKIRKVYENHGMYKSWANTLAKHVKDKLSVDNIKNKMLETLVPSNMLFKADYVFVSDMFVEDYTGGAELSMESLVKTCPSQNILKIKSSELSEIVLENNKDAKWVFGNIANANPDIIRKFSNSNIDYTFVEFDYKFCKHRNPVLYEMVEGASCDYKNTDQAQLIVDFINSSARTYFMSEKQSELYQEYLPSLDQNKLTVLSSLFDDEFFETIERFRGRKKANKWVVLGSRSWVKGLNETESYCKKKGYDYEVLWNLEYKSFLEKLSESKGLCFKPSGLDTCPRMVIEARLLGCDLDLNELVQHCEEEWFNMPYQEMVDYLKSRPGYFWKTWLSVDQTEKN